MATETVDDASRRHLMRRAATVGLMMRNCVNLLVAVVALADPRSLADPPGRALLAALAAWSVYRIVTRSHRATPVAVDYLFVVAVCLALPLLVRDPTFYLSNSAPQAIAGTAVISFSVALPAVFSLPLSGGIAAAYAFGAATVIGWMHVPDILAVYYFSLQWVTAALIRAMLLRVASAVDQSRERRQATELDQKVGDAVHAFDREQLALLHDTAASTLLMVGQGASLPADRLAAQARRDLELLNEQPWASAPAQTELVAALNQCAQHLVTPVRFAGTPQVWLDGDTAKTVVSAAREAMNNVDRHAKADVLHIEVSAGSVVLRDDGVGFDTDRPRSGHGIVASMVARMQRAGGNATVRSAPGRGTVVELTWGTESPDAPVTDPDRMIERVRRIYGLALTAYALMNLVTAVPYAVIHLPNASAQIVIASIAAISTVAAVPGILFGRWRPAWVAVVALFGVTVAAPLLLLSAQDLGTQADWAQSSLGWCLLPSVLGISTRRGASLLVGCWLVGAVADAVRNPTDSMLVNIGLGTASILAVQLFALAFNALMRDAAAKSLAETQERQRLITAERVSRAVREDYRRRYASLVDNVLPLLEQLSHGSPADGRLQRAARAESRRLRALFDQASTVEHPLLQRLRPAVDDAERRQVDVVVDINGDMPTLSDSDIDHLVAPLVRILDDSTTSARVVLTATADEFSASIVSHGVPAAPTGDWAGSSDDVEVIFLDDTAWCLVSQPLHGQTRTRSPVTT